MKPTSTKGKKKRNYFDKGKVAKKIALNDISKECGDGKIYSKNFVGLEYRYNYFLKNIDQILDLLPHIKITSI